MLRTRRADQTRSFGVLVDVIRAKTRSALLPRKVRALITCSTILLAILHTAVLCAQPQSVRAMVHSTWRGHDGAPQSIDALAQALDGRIWIASAGRLYRFNGITFELFRPLNDNPAIEWGTVRALLVTRDDDLWVFRMHGAPFRVHRDRIQISSFAGSSSADAIYEPNLDQTGRILGVEDYHTVVELDPDLHWRPSGSFSHIGGRITSLHLDHDGVAWVISDGRLCRCNPHGVLTRSIIPGDTTSSFIVEGTHHTLWVGSSSASTRLSDEQQANIFQLDTSNLHILQALHLNGIDDLYAASDGTVWAAAENQGLWRLPAFSPVKLKSFLRDKDYIDIPAEQVIEATDGSIWVGGTTGLDSFRVAHFMPALPQMRPGFWTVCACQNGDKWVADDIGKLVRLRAGKSTSYKNYKAQGLGSELTCDPTSGAWVLEDSTLWRVGDAAFALPLPSSLHWGRGLSILQDTVAIAAANYKGSDEVWFYRAKRWSRRYVSKSGERVSSTMLIGSDTFLALLTDGRVLRISGRVVSPILPSTPNQTASSTGLAQTRRGPIVYGLKGLSLLLGDHFQALRFTDPSNTRLITGLAEAANGDFWLNGAAGVVHVRSSDVDCYLQSRCSSIISERWTEGDYTGPDEPWFGRNSVHIDASDEVWVSTMQGVMHFAPSSLFRSATLPRLSILSISSEGKQQADTGAFPPGTQNLNINYFGLLLSSPKSVQYRYKLEGVDKDWREGGSSTDVMYSHLGPGPYRFRVMASSGNGTWTQPVVSSWFWILPRYWQTWWFRMLSVGSSICLVVFVFQWRLHTLKERQRVLAEERSEERGRIARELHDTLLQGVEGLLLNFEVVRSRLVQGENVLPLLDRSLVATESLVIEGRERIATIRYNRPSRDHLQKRLKLLCSALSEESGLDITLGIRGRTRELLPTPAEELYYIAKEAVRNSIKHSSASHIRVMLQYSRRLFRMTCTDDGHGFDSSREPDDLSRAPRWGLQGIRERAASVHAQVRILTQRNTGTEVSVRLDSKFAYRDPASGLPE